MSRVNFYNIIYTKTLYIDYINVIPIYKNKILC